MLKMWFNMPILMVKKVLVGLLSNKTEKLKTVEFVGFSSKKREKKKGWSLWESYLSFISFRVINYDMDVI